MSVLCRIGRNFLFKRDVQHLLLWLLMMSPHASGGGIVTLTMLWMQVCWQQFMQVKLEHAASKMQSLG